MKIVICLAPLGSGETGFFCVLPAPDRGLDAGTIVFESFTRSRKGEHKDEGDK